VTRSGEQRVFAKIDQGLAAFPYRDGQHSRVVYENGLRIFLHIPPDLRTRRLRES
jgi:hypothetical protein